MEKQYEKLTQKNLVELKKYLIKSKVFGLFEIKRITPCQLGILVQSKKGDYILEDDGIVPLTPNNYSPKTAEILNSVWQKFLNEKVTSSSEEISK